MRHLVYKREKYTFINANIQVINTILKVKREIRQTFMPKCSFFPVNECISALLVAAVSPK